MRFHHIGIATDNIKDTLESLKKVMEIKDISDVVFDEKQDANLCMVTFKDGVKLELIEGHMVENLVKKRHYLYHTCYEVDNIESTMETLINDGAMQISEIKEAKLFEERRVVFLSWKLGIIELVEGD